MLNEVKLNGIKNIDIKLVNDIYIIEIGENEHGSLVFDWQKLNMKNVEIIVNKNSTLDIEELSESSMNIHYIFNEYCNVTLNIFSEDLSKDVSYVLSLKSNANVEVAYADFSRGKCTLNVKADLEEIGSSIKWHLASLSQGEDYKDYSINFNHLVMQTNAKMENYGVCKDRSTLSFLGDATIFKGAKKSSTKQNARIMVFDKTCHAKASPKLCIYENDVEASHGASEGQINQEHVYYLMSRGLSEDEAKKLITFGYLYPIINYFSDEETKSKIENCIVNRA